MNLSYKDWWCDEFVSGGYMPWHKKDFFQKEVPMSVLSSCVWISILTCFTKYSPIIPHLMSTSGVSDAGLHLRGVNKAYSTCLEFTSETWLYMVQIKNAMRGSRNNFVYFADCVVKVQSSPSPQPCAFKRRLCPMGGRYACFSLHKECLSLIHEKAKKVVGSADIHHIK